ncbi:MAG: hypothetical protein ACLPLP_03445, partial [Mycobacterium sp.]
MGDIATGITKEMGSFFNDHLEPFISRYTALPNAPGANDSAGWEKDSAGLVSAIEDFVKKLAHRHARAVDGRGQPVIAGERIVLGTHEAQYQEPPVIAPQPRDQT